MGTFDGGREKAPAALCRKIINAKRNKHKSIDVWGMENKHEVFYLLMIALKERWMFLIVILQRCIILEVKNRFQLIK